MKNMITNANKLFADYESDHIVMIYPHMYQKTYFYNNLLDIYKRLIDLFNINNIVLDVTKMAKLLDNTPLISISSQIESLYVN